jgi:hypothetical protein
MPTFAVNTIRLDDDVNGVDVRGIDWHGRVVCPVMSVNPSMDGFGYVIVMINVSSIATGECVN